MRTFFTTLCLALATALYCAADSHVWIFAGQSNTGRGQKQYAAALSALVESKGFMFREISSTAPGASIEAWLDPEHRDHALWKEIEDGVTTAKNNGETIKGMVWYQGESNAHSPLQYADPLRTLISRVRRLAGTQFMPVIIVQLAPHSGCEPGSIWNVGIIREIQRRVALEDDNIELVTAIDCRLRDYTVHVGDNHSRIATRIALAIDFAAPTHPGENSAGPGVRKLPWLQAGHEEERLDRELRRAPEGGERYQRQDLAEGHLPGPAEQQGGLEGHGPGCRPDPLQAKAVDSEPEA